MCPERTPMLNIEWLKNVSQQMPDGRWIPARPEPDTRLRSRLRDAWAVFMCRAEAVCWPTK